MVLGGIVAAAFACLTDASAETAMTIAIPVAVLGQLLGIVFRSIIAALTHVADSAIDNGKFKTAYRMHICAGSGLYAVMYFLPIFLAVFVGTDLVQAIVAVVFMGFKFNGSHAAAGVDSDYDPLEDDED